MSDPALSDVKAFLARRVPRCTIYVCPHFEHVLQIYAGLYALHAEGCIAVRQRFAPALPVSPPHGLFVEVEGAGLVYFDVHDGANFQPEVLERVALYAKRAYRASMHRAAGERLVPLGLNYSIYTERAGFLELAKALRRLRLTRTATKRFGITLARLVPGMGGALGLPTVGALSRPALAGEPARAIFVARPWDPKEVPPLPEAAVREMNDMRAACIRLLRARLGERFFGGFERSAYALEHYPDCVVDAGISTHRRDYLRRLRGYSVCVATNGLWDSIGWKFAEYLALGKAIVCEPMKFEVPGPLAPGRNFLVFRTPEDCAARVAGLLEAREARERMMANNAAYFREFAAPEAVVGRVLYAALSASTSRAGRLAA
jgi:glycosyltransferase involved in cell wall biosynthesis